MQKKNNQKFIYFFLIVILFIPIIQQLLSFANEKKLAGSIIISKNINFEWEDWFSGEYQKNKDNFHKDNFGFRPDFVRINNQLDYSIYNVLHASAAIEGKSGYLFEDDYISAYYGTDFIGEKAINDQVNKLKYIQKKLKLINKEIFVLLAPGKGTFFPEFIPDEYHKDSILNTNYKSYKKHLSNNNINTIDYQDWFLKHKESSPYPLFPMAGIHWSRYGEILVADSILTYLGELLNLSTPDIVIDEIELSEKNKFRDYDVGNGFNTLFEVKTMPMGYPKFHFETNDSTISPRLMVVGDSFYWGVFPKRILGKGDFWYYNKQIYYGNSNKYTPVENVDILEEIDKHQAIMILNTDGNLHQLGNGFIDRLFTALKTKYKE